MLQKYNGIDGETNFKLTSLNFKLINKRKISLKHSELSLFGDYCYRIVFFI